MCAFIILDFYLYAFVALILNRLLDGLDGAMARLTAPTPFGGYIDIVFDFIIYGGFVLSFGLSDSVFLMSSCLLIFLYIGTSSTFLAYAAILKNYDPTFKNESTTEINVLEHKTVKAVCKAKGNPAPVITWNHNGYIIGNIPFHLSLLIHKSLFIDVSGNNKSIIIFQNVTRRDMGTLMCIAKNNVPPARSKTIKFSVNCK